MEANSLFYIIREPQVNSGHNINAVILLHGVGGNEESLSGLASALPADFYVISVRGPLTFAPGRYGWFAVDFSSGKPVYNLEQEAASRELLNGFINEMARIYELKNIYLGGFSQGAIMSYTIGLMHPEKMSGVIALGGRILEEVKPLISTYDNLKELKVFTGHGAQDNTLPVQYARAAKDYLETLLAGLFYREYNTGHQVIPEMMADVSEWIVKNKNV